MSNNKTFTDLRKKFFRYTIPSIAAMWVFSFYSMVDGFFVSMGNGPMALASVNVAMPFINLLFGLSILCSAGASTVISVCLGRGEMREAKSAFMTNLVSLIAFSLVFTGVSLVFNEKIALFLGATPNLFGDVSDYLRIVSYFIFFFIVTYYFEVTVRADGYPKLAAISVGIAAVSNIALDYIFVIRFGWGVPGAAWATGIAQLLSCFILATHFLTSRTKLGFGKFVYNLSHVTRSIRLGIGDSVTEFSVGVVIFLFNNRILAVIGESGIASYTVIAYVSTLVVMTMSGVSQGMQPLVGFCHGRGDSESCAYLLKLALKTAVFCSVAWFAVMELFPGAFVSLFIDKTVAPEIYAQTIPAFRTYAISYLFIGVNVVLATYFSSIERPAFGINLSLCRGLVVIALTLFAMSKALGESGIWLSPTVSEVICVAIAGASLFALRSEKQNAFEDAKTA